MFLIRKWQERKKMDVKEVEHEYGYPENLLTFKILICILEK